MHNLLSRYRELSPTVKASIWFVVCNVIQKTTQILTTPIYTRILTKTQYGEYTVFLSWVEVATIFATLNIFYSGYNVGMERFRDDRANYTISMHGLCFSITTCWVVLLFPLATLISPIIGVPSKQLRMLLLYMYVFPIFQFWSARKKYDYQYKPLILVTAISSICSIALGTAFAIVFENKSDGVILAKIIAETLIAIPLIYNSIKGLKTLYNSFYWKYALKFNIPLIPHYLSTMILNHSDRLMIVLLCSASDAGIYSVAYSIAMLMTIIQNAINSATVPWMYTKLRSNNLDGVAQTTTAIIAFVASLNLLLLTIAPEAIKLISTAEYYDAVYVIPPVTFGVFLTAIYGLFVNIEFYFNYNIFAAVASAIAAVSNIILNYIFIKMFGYLAAGYTTFASYLLLTIMHYCGLKKVSKKNDLLYKRIFCIKNMALIIIGYAVFSVFVFATYSLTILRYSLLIIVIVTVVLKKSTIAAAANTIISNNVKRGLE